MDCLTFDLFLPFDLLTFAMKASRKAFAVGVSDTYDTEYHLLTFITAREIHASSVEKYDYYILCYNV